MLGGSTVQTSRVPRHQRGLPTGMTDAGESLLEPCVLKGEGGPPSPTSDFGGAGGVADVAPARWTAPGVNLRRVLRVGSWNVLSLSKDYRLPHLSDELSRLRLKEHKSDLRHHTITNSLVLHTDEHGHLPRWENAAALYTKNEKKEEKGGGHRIHCFQDHNGNR